MKPLLLASATMLAALAFVPSSGAIALSLKPSVRVTDASLTVGDVVEAQPALPAAVSGLSLGSSPALNDKETLSRQTVAAILATPIAARTDLGPAVWTGADSCIVERPARAVSPSSLSAAILPCLQDATGGKGRIKIEEFGSEAPILLPPGDVGAQAELPSTALLHPWVTASVTFYVDGRKAATQPVRFRWSWTCDAWQAAKNLGAGDEYAQENFRLVPIDAIKADGNYLTELPPVDGTVMGRRVNAGAMLVAADLAPKKVVQRGDQVTVNYVQPNFKISMKAIALQDGARGQVISVKNTTSQRSVFAKVVGDSTLEVVQ